MFEVRIALLITPSRLYVYRDVVYRRVVALESGVYTELCYRKENIMDVLCIFLCLCCIVMLFVPYR